MTRPFEGIHMKPWAFYQDAICPNHGHTILIRKPKAALQNHCFYDQCPYLPCGDAFVLVASQIHFPAGMGAERQRTIITLAKTALQCQIRGITAASQ